MRSRTGWFLTLTWAAVTLGFFCAPASAQKWPEKTVRIVTPFAPGGGTDVFARLLAQRLSETYGQQFIVENRAGAGSTLGTEYVAKSAPDGYTLLMTSASFSFNPGLYPKLRYDSVRDFVAVSQVVRVPHVIVVLPSFPAKNLQEFVKLARERPGDVLYASSGAGSAMHLAGALFGTVTATKLIHVPYKGGAATVSAVMGGEATTAFNTLETVIGQLRSKRLRALAVSTRERAPALPDVPTAIEAGVKDYEAIGWFGLLAPTGTPQALVDQLSGEIAKTMSTPAMRERAAQEGATAIGSTPAEFDRFVKSEIAKWTRIIRDAGIKLE
jgi:tripartite-type tricarboxylate transporter receptor subunit TctC